MATAPRKATSVRPQRQPRFAHLETRFLFCDCAARHSAQWVADKLARHPADRVYANDPANLSFEGCERFEAIEAVFALQFGRN